MDNILHFIKFFFSIYFTNKPHVLYKKSYMHGNFAYSGIAWQLIFSQYAFWASNSINLLNIYLYKKNNIYIHLYLFGISIFLYTRSIQIILDVMKQTNYLKTQ